MATKSRSAAAKKAWKTRRSRYGKSGVGKSSSKAKASKSLTSKANEILRKTSIYDTVKGTHKKLIKAGLTKAQADKKMKSFMRPPSSKNSFFFS